VNFIVVASETGRQLLAVKGRHTLHYAKRIS
jgi:hypothetical protein